MERIRNSEEERGVVTVRDMTSAEQSGASPRTESRRRSRSNALAPSGQDRLDSPRRDRPLGASRAPKPDSRGASE